MTKQNYIKVALSIFITFGMTLYLTRAVLSLFGLFQYYIEVTYAISVIITLLTLTTKTVREHNEDFAKLGFVVILSKLWFWVFFIYGIGVGNFDESRDETSKINNRETIVAVNKTRENACFEGCRNGGVLGIVTGSAVGLTSGYLSSKALIGAGSGLVTGAGIASFVGCIGGCVYEYVNWSATIKKNTDPGTINNK